MDIASISGLTALSLPVGPLEVLLVTNNGPHYTFLIGTLGRTLGCIIQYYYGFYIPTKRQLFTIPSDFKAILLFKASPAPGLVCNMSLGYSKVSLWKFASACFIINAIYSFIFCYGSLVHLLITNWLSLRGFTFYSNYSSDVRNAQSIKHVLFFPLYWFIFFNEKRFHVFNSYLRKKCTFLSILLLFCKMS